MPMVFKITISRAKVSAVRSLPMALPPYLMTNVCPAKRWIYGSASLTVLAVRSSSSLVLMVLISMVISPKVSGYRL
jgi:hypothetical protein